MNPIIHQDVGKLKTSLPPSLPLPTKWLSQVNVCRWGVGIDLVSRAVRNEKLSRFRLKLMLCDVASCMHEVEETTGDSVAGGSVGLT